MDFLDINNWDKMAKKITEVTNENTELKKAIKDIERVSRKRKELLELQGICDDMTMGCEYCNEKNMFYNSDFGVQMFEDTHFVRIEYETTEGEKEYYDMEVSFCPWCGRDLSISLNS